jgi:Glycosyltransferase family 9 (heptosyltransferase)
VRSGCYALRVTVTVGLAWAGNPTHGNDRNRSIRLTDLAELAQVKGVDFFSLQVGPAAGQIAASPFNPMNDFTNELKDFADTAGLVQSLDLVISVDTAVAHLAGAMGKPVWVLLPFAPDWRWLLNRADSPWYPTMKLFRQPKSGDWGSVVGQVAAGLEELVAEQAI